MHGKISLAAGDFFAGDLIAFTTALLITLLLLVLTLRAAKLPGTPRINILFAVCGVVWSIGGLAEAALAASGIDRDRSLESIALAIQYTGAAAFPIPVLATWGTLAAGSARRRARWLLIASCCSAALLGAWAWSAGLSGVQPFPAIATQLIAYNAAILLLAGAATSLRRNSTPRAIYIPSWIMVAAVCGAILGVAVGYLHAPRHIRFLVGFSVTHLVLLVVLCAFFLFARFRYADVFVRYGVRILLAGTWAAVIGFVAQSTLLAHISNQARAPRAAHVFLVILLANGLLLSFTVVDDRLSALVTQWLFHPPDYRAEARDLGDRLRLLYDAEEVLRASERAARTPLDLRAARIAAIDGTAPWPAALLEGEAVDLERSNSLRAKLPLEDAELLMPITSGEQVSHVLLVTPNPARPGLVMHDVNYLQTVTVQCGHRLDALRREQESVERQSREALLLQQVTEAELRALRAQINPHFLFNSLNTIADLIVRDPPRAEIMTVRLAGVFRHVLAHSSRALTSIRDEMEFLRTYLYIEEARFGDRLQVEFDVAPEVAAEQIPSLILQPVVENALKHGLGPKTGPGRLWISACAVGAQVRLRVEDDGLGPPFGRDTSQGLGLVNIAERLTTLYRDRAAVTLEPREGGGSRVTILLPRAMDASNA